MMDYPNPAPGVYSPEQISMDDYVGEKPLNCTERKRKTREADRD